MAFYIKKPIPVEAVQWFKDVKHSAIFSHSYVDVDEGRKYTNYYVKTLENSQLELKEGCWIVGPGARGEYWPVQDDIFKATYILVDQEVPTLTP